MPTATNSMLNLLEKRKHRLSKIYEGGGLKAVAKQKEKGKLTARERIEYLTDKGSPFVEIGSFAGYEMYEEYGGCPAAGTVAGIGYVSGKQCIIVGNDQTVKAGAWVPDHRGKKTADAEIAWRIIWPLLLGRNGGVSWPCRRNILTRTFARVFPPCQ